MGISENEGLQEISFHAMAEIIIRYLHFEAHL